MTRNKILIFIALPIALFVIGVIYFISQISSLAPGTLGGFDGRTFPTSKKSLVKAIASLYAAQPDYIIPDKWKPLDTWKESGYDFLDSRIFYFNSPPEEMYYVSFLGDANDSVQKDTTHTSIAIRAVTNGIYGWSYEDVFKSSEKKRIEKRFDDEIISKLEDYTNTKAIKGY